jgi:hypothetical protein
MEAKIPIAFRASGKVLAAGTYQVRMKSRPTGSRLLIISSRNTGQDALALAYPSGEAKAAWKAEGDAVLSFQCGVSRCDLTDVWSGSAEPVYHVPAMGLGKDEPTRTAEIVMHAVKGD